MTGTIHTQYTYTHRHTHTAHSYTQIQRGRESESVENSLTARNVKEIHCAVDGAARNDEMAIQFVVRQQTLIQQGEAAHTNDKPIAKKNTVEEKRYWTFFPFLQ